MFNQMNQAIFARPFCTPSAIDTHPDCHFGRVLERLAAARDDNVAHTIR
jgi:hypothetical protein